MLDINVGRYRLIDALTRKELSEFYRTASVEERISLIQEFARSEAGFPEELAYLASQDESVKIRRTLACSISQLCYTKPRSLSSALDLEAVLGKDSDELVRCALFENPAFRPSTTSFSDASAVERLAMVRNSNVDMELICKIYDFDDPEFHLTNFDRLALIRAFCTNEAKIKAMQKGPLDYEDFLDAWSHVATYGDGKLWKTALRWLDLNSEVTALTLKNFGYTEQDTLEIYEKLIDRKYVSVRRALFDNPVLRKKSFAFRSLLEKGISDAEPAIRYVCIALHPTLSANEVKIILDKGDRSEYAGLLSNKHLDLSYMELIYGKLADIKGKDFIFMENYVQDFTKRYSEKRENKWLYPVPPFPIPEERMTEFERVLAKKMWVAEKRQYELIPEILELRDKTKLSIRMIRWILLITGILFLFTILKNQ